MHFGCVVVCVVGDDYGGLAQTKHQTKLLPFQFFNLKKQFFASCFFFILKAEYI
jgi:hypothetical protein